MRRDGSVDETICDFAGDYADRAERDYKASRRRSEKDTSKRPFERLISNGERSRHWTGRTSRWSWAARRCSLSCAPRLPGAAGLLAAPAVEDRVERAVHRQAHRADVTHRGR